MDFRTTLQQVGVLLDSSLNSLYVSHDGTFIYGSKPKDIPVRQDESILRIYFSRLSSMLRRYSYHTRILFKASQNREGPPLETALKILHWGGVRPKYSDPMLKLLQTPMDKIYSLLQNQEKQWKELDSVISWNQFLLICKKLDKEKDVFRSAYIALGFQNPRVHTLQKFKLYLHHIGLIEQSSNLLRMLACRICTTALTTHEVTAVTLIMKEVPPPPNCLPSPAGCTFIANFKTDILYYSVQQVVSAIYSPSQTMEEARKTTLSIRRPYLRPDAFRETLCEQAQQFYRLPEFLQNDGIRLVRNAQKKGYLSKGDKLSDFNRIDLMALHFLYHSTELHPKERYYIEEGDGITMMQKNPMELMGNAVRAYFEHNLPFFLSQFERGIENGEMSYWETNKEGFPQRKKIEIIDPLSFLMEDLIKLVDWIDSLFFMEKVQQLIHSGE